MQFENLKDYRCNNVECEASLNTPEEFAIGLCSGCIEYLRGGQNVVGVCWYCGTITHMSEVHRRLKDAFPKKRTTVLFAKGCRKCQNGNDEEELNWMTVKSNSGLGSMFVNEFGELVPHPDVIRPSSS